MKVNNTTGEIEIGPDYSKKYLTFETIQSGTFKFLKTITYSIDGGTTWVALSANTNTPTIAAGSKIMWKGNLTPQTVKGIGNFSATGKFDAYGNVMSLLYGDNFIGQTDLTGKDWAFYHLFNNNAKIVNTQNLILPATMLANHCYNGMFRGCTSLTTTPELPATTLAQSCYAGMFEGCTSLTTTPALPATTLVNACYQGMFQDCTSLTTAPALPATTLENACYSEMFRGCTNLVTQSIVPNSVKPVESMCCTNMYTDTQVPINTNDYAYEAWVFSPGGSG